MGLLPLSLTDLECERGMTILLGKDGARYLIMNSLEYLLDARDTESLRIIRDMLFSLPLEEHTNERNSH